MTAASTPSTGVRLPEGARFLAQGLGFTEGPAALDDHAVLVASINRGHVYRVDLDGSGAELAVETGGGPNGIAVGSAGEVLIAQNGATVMPSRSTLTAAPSIQRWAAGTLTTVVPDGVDAPSDCVVGPDGRFWFTDPPDHSLDGTPAPGRLLSWDATTGDLHVERDGLLFPNGLAFDATGERIYVAETAPGRITRFRLTAHGCQPDGWSVELPHGKPDGIAVDVRGWLWVAGSVGGNVMAFDARGDIQQEIRFGTGSLVTSVCFAGPGLDTLVVTAAKGGSVIALPAPHPGLALPGLALSARTARESSS
ncbi:SMP-30/gluconolactonase/LRE family protein [Saccharopolyspora phatthalungensis]|uniref:Gluconolactonase n=1 Tax=Saccharopolyspora phatthalungensis TaxID=664693 RepID=A0A840QJ13_9PSEU|nr:SMP-30/gluconolactonase/LRE family protein [Saccharopolyspora phatthalungensis]MBB5158968.1 gluconolactonase [Saccharopolyspora phatthalungensis]